MKTSLILGIVVAVVVIIGGVYAYSTLTATPTKTFKVAAIYTTPIEEDWNQVLHQAMLKARTNLGITYNYTENVSPSDCERVMREYINSGFNLVFTDSWGFWDVSDSVAPQFPSIYFAQGSGLNTHLGNNTVLFDNTLQEAAFEAGALAAKLTTTGEIGVVAAMAGPGDVASLINGYIAGAKYVNSSISVNVQYIDSWYDPATANQKASIMIASGVDVIYSERVGIYEACVQGGNVVCLAFGNVVNQTGMAPNVVVGNVIWNLYPLVYDMIVGAQNGNFSAGIKYPTLSNGGAYFQWNDAMKTKYTTLYTFDQELVTQLKAGTIHWNKNITLPNGTVVDGTNYPISTPDFGTPQP
jgi:basic membrane lipoprotein Med (substrate-binding protein (PBP1-ABC) superfamily)